MSVDIPLWQLPFSSGQQEGLGELRAALLTTFEPPDADVLVEDVLPGWLGLSRDAAESGPERTTFLVDLQRRVKSLRGHLAVFSSSRPTTGRSHWLWNDVFLCTVGSCGPVVQHAKLWLLHRGPGKGQGETLEVVISSTNLTRPALRGQVQAGWRVVLPLGKASALNEASWGTLPAFLTELGRQSGETGKEVIPYWNKKVFPRARCPGVQFLASVPGKHRREDLQRSGRHWGVEGLKRLRPVKPTRRIDIVVPTVGSFGDEELEEWASSAGTEAKRIRLAWIPEGSGHPWATDHGWEMPKKTVKAATKADAQFLSFPDPADGAREIEAFQDQWEESGKRMLHGKLYWIRDAKRCRLLVTSANWSRAAWGTRMANGGLSIENFELGVVVESSWTPLDELPALDGDPFARLPRKQDPPPAVSWAEATWDGNAIAASARVRPGERLRPHVAVEFSDGRRVTKQARWNEGAQNAKTRIPWPAKAAFPPIICLGVVGEDLDHMVPVADIRPPGKGIPEHYSGVDPGDVTRLELALLEERYGGPSADTVPEEGGDSEPGDDSTGTPSREPPDPNAEKSRPADYSVPIIEDAKAKLQIVSCWTRRAEAVRGDRDGRRLIVNDGERLAQLWRLTAKTDIATRVALHELDAVLGALE